MLSTWVGGGIEGAGMGVRMLGLVMMGMGMWVMGMGMGQPVPTKCHGEDAQSISRLWSTSGPVPPLPCAAVPSAQHTAGTGKLC